jgi:hypothetical protein
MSLALHKTVMRNHKTIAKVPTDRFSRFHYFKSPNKIPGNRLTSAILACLPQIHPIQPKWNNPFANGKELT